MAPLRDRVAALCATLPGAEASEPFGPGHEVWKVGAKIFAAVDAADAGVSVKCADVETASLLIEAGVAERAPYFHRSWARLPKGVDDDELAHRIRASYDIVRAGLPKKVREALAAGEAA